MSNPTIKVKRSTVQGKVPTTGQLGLGEIAINHYDGKVFVLQDTGGVGVGTTVISVGSIDDWQIKTSNYTASNGDKLIADTSGGSFTITLPPSPYTGFNITFADGDDWSNNNLTISRNGSTIEDISDNLILDVSDTIVTLIYDGSTWQVFSQVGAQGPPGPSYWVETNAGIHTLSNVGIGTTNPTKKLEVAGNEVSFSPNTAGKHTHLFTTNASDDGRYLIKSDTTTVVDIQANGSSYFNGGSIGIGTVNPIKKLQIGSISGNFSYTSTDALGIVSPQNPGISVRNTGNNSEFDLEVSNSAAGMRMGSSTSHNLNLMTANQSRITITSGGNVGIGTDNPETKLHVSDGHTASADNFDSNIVLAVSKNTTADSFAGIAINSGNNAASFIHFGDTDDSNVGRLDYSHSDNAFQFFTNGDSTQRLRITSGGVVQINGDVQDAANDIDTSNTKLTIKQSAMGLEDGIYIERPSERRGYYARVATSGNAEDALVFGMNHWGTETDHLLALDRAGNVTMTAGRVGIGTDNPGTKLTIHDTSGTHITLSNSWSSGAHSISFLGGSLGGSGTSPNSCAARIVCTATAPGGAATGDLKFITNSGDSFVDALYLSPTGNVGIGTDNPPTKFFVKQGSSSMGFAEYNNGATIWLDGSNGDITGGDYFNISANNSQQLTFGYAGSENVRIDSSGRFGIGTTPDSPLHVVGTNGTGLRIGYTNNSNYFDADTQIFRSNNSTSEYGRWDSSGRLLVGTSASIATIFGLEGLLQVDSNSDSTSFVQVGNYANTNGSPVLSFDKSRSGTVGTKTVVQSGDGLGTLSFNGADGTNFIPGAFIQAQVDGTPGANDMPGRLVFSTTADGASFPTERMRIDSSGRLLVGASSAVAPDGTNYPAFQVNRPQSSGLNASALIREVETSTSWPILYINKNRSNNAMQADNKLGSVDYYGDTGSSDKLGARIEAAAEGTWTTSSHPTRLVFSTCASGASSPTERMLISSFGVPRFFSSDTGIVSGVTAVAGTSETIFRGRHTATNILNGTDCIYIRSNGNVENTNNSYGAISDIKLKENIVDASSQWDDIKALRPVNYNFKEGQTHTQIGLVAQEVELVSPGLVSESPDRDEDGNDLGTTTKSVNYSVLYMKAVKALQEAMERIETLEAKVVALESA